MIDWTGGVWGGINMTIKIIYVILYSSGNWFISTTSDHQCFNVLMVVKWKRDMLWHSHTQQFSMHQANQNELNFGAGRADQRRAMKETHAHTNTKKEEEYAERSVQISVDSVYFTTIAKWIFHMCYLYFFNHGITDWNNHKHQVNVVLAINICHKVNVWHFLCLLVYRKREREGEIVYVANTSHSTCTHAIIHATIFNGSPYEIRISLNILCVCVNYL